MKKIRIIILPVLLLGMIVMIYAGYRLIETKQVYKEGNTAYEGLSNQVRKTTAVNDRTSSQTQAVELAEEFAVSEYSKLQMAEEGRPKIYIPEFEIDFDLLKTINDDSVAWLYGPDTEIDYPVMKAADYNYYISHLPDGTSNANGALFIDYNNSPDFSDRLTVIYGHHMKSGRMFGSLVGYKNQGYYNENPYMYLYTQQMNYRIDLMYGCVIDAGQWSERAFMYEENIGSLIEYAKQNTTFESGVEYKEGDRVVALSTCSYEFDEARYVVLGILAS